jgi:acyl CoA:acetate/3-ketoacid CoA transferase beta subunit
MNTFGLSGAVANLMPSVWPREYFRPAQVDARGSFNNIAFGVSYEKPRLGLPGVGGIPDVTDYLNEVCLCVPRHSRITFVRELDFRSSLGHEGQRRPGSGPQYLISYLGQFDFKGGRMRIATLQPGVDLRRVLAKTGFEI